MDTPPPRIELLKYVITRISHLIETNTSAKALGEYQNIYRASKAEWPTAMAKTLVHKYTTELLCK